MFFLIPVAIVGYQIYDKKQKEKAALLEAELPPPSPGEEESGSDDDEKCENKRTASVDRPPLVLQKSDVSSSSSSSEGGSSPQKERPEWIKGVFDMFQNMHHDPFAIRCDREALTYEVLGNQSSNALPFPKTSQH